MEGPKFKSSRGGVGWGRHCSNRHSLPTGSGGNWANLETDPLTFLLLSLLSQDLERDLESELVCRSEAEREPSIPLFLAGDSEEPERGLLVRDRGCELLRERDREREREELDAEEEEEREEL